MTDLEIKELLNSDDYSFLNDFNSIALLGLGGSHAYGLAGESSDLDIRGVALNTSDEVLLGRDFGTYTDKNTDTVIHSFNKFLKLLSDCNPNTIELLGLKLEHYLRMNEIGRLLLQKKSMFLSKRAIYTFGGYANQMLRRLENKVDRTVSLPEHLKHIVETLRVAKYDISCKREGFDNDMIQIYTNGEELLANIHVADFSLREFNGVWSELKNIVSAYDKIGARNSKAIEHGKLGKHMCSLVRCYYMLFDILKDGQVITYREDEHDLLLDLKEGRYLDYAGKPVKDFYVLVDELESKAKDLEKITKLPDKPDYTQIDDFKKHVNRIVIERGI